MDQQTIVLLGGNILNGGVVSNKKKYGASKVIVVDWNDDPAVKGDEFFQCDIKDADKILEYLEHKGEKNILFAYTSADLAVATQRAIHDHYGLRTLENSVIEQTLEKSVMTDVWKKNNLLNRQVFLITSVEQLKNWNRNCAWIVKPNLCSGSRGISILNPGFFKEDLFDAYEKALKASWDNFVVIEEFIDGTEYTVEMLGDSFGNVDVVGISKKYHTRHTTNNKIAIKLHYNPKDVEDCELNRIADYGRACYKALGLHTSMGHLELIVAKDGRISPLEIGARSSGYIASHCVDAVMQDSFLCMYMDVIRGAKLRNRNCFSTDRSSMLFFYDMPEGEIIHEGSIMDFMNTSISSLACDRHKIVKGAHFNNIDGDGERHGFEILAGEREILTIDNVLEAENAFNNWVYKGIKDEKH